MSENPTPPAVSEAVREAVARPSLFEQLREAAQQEAAAHRLFTDMRHGPHYEAMNTENTLSWKAASEIARLTGERDAAREAVALCNNSFGSYSFHLNPHPAEQIEKIKAQARSEWQRAEAAEAETARLRAENDDLMQSLARAVLEIASLSRAPARAALTSQEKPKTGENLTRGAS